MLTPRQRQIYEILIASVCASGRQPTYRELMDRLGIKSPNGIACHFRALEAKGLIRQVGNHGVEFTKVFFEVVDREQSLCTDVAGFRSKPGGRGDTGEGAGVAAAAI